MISKKLFAELETTAVDGKNISASRYSIPAAVERLVKRASLKPRIREWDLLDYTANGGEMNIDTEFRIAYEINYKLEIIFDPINFLQALAYLHLLGVIDSAGEYTDDYMPYINDPYVIEGVEETLAKTKNKKNVHFGVYTECPSHAMELGIEAGCGPIMPGYRPAPPSSRWYGDGKGTISAFLVATDNLPGYYHLRGLNDAFRIWCMYPLFIRDNEVVWIDPRRDANGMLPKEDSYIYDPMFIWSDDYIGYQKWLYREFEKEIFEWEWWSVW